MQIAVEANCRSPVAAVPVDYIDCPGEVFRVDEIECGDYAIAGCAWLIARKVVCGRFLYGSIGHFA